MANNHEWTGERLETFITDETMAEHLHRYSIALELVRGKNVLDVACGEGYGANLLAKSAKQVKALDIDKKTIEKAKLKYNSENLNFLEGSILQLPFNENSFDIITCFETIEHVEDHKTLMSELKRVLVPDGTLIISTPEKSKYSDNAEIKNTYHKKELYESEFKDLLNSFFKFILFYKQSSHTTSTIIKDTLHDINRFFSGDYDAIKNISTFEPSYWIAIASDKNLVDLSSSIYYHNQKLSEIINTEKELLKKTMTYRIGEFILFPIKLIRKMFSK